MIQRLPDEADPDIQFVELHFSIFVYMSHIDEFAFCLSSSEVLLFSEIDDI